MQDVPLAKIGGKGLFVKEIEDALLNGDVDIAVHSMKDVPVELPEGLEIAFVPEREDPRDVFISADGRRLQDLTGSARIGTGSLRRGFQLRHLIPGIEIVPLRGNLDTRIKKIEKENLDGIIVAAAGMKRMGWTERITEFLPIEMMLPSVGQGVVGIEVRKNDHEIKQTLSFLNHSRTWKEVMAERAFLKRIGGGCQLPVAAYANILNGEMRVRALLGSIDGRIMIRDEISGHCEDGETLGTALAEKILSQGGKEILEDVYSKNC